MRVLWKRPAGYAGAAVLLCGLACAAGPAAGDKKAEGVKEGQKAPDVELPATQIGKVLPGQKDAKTLHLKDLRGKKNVVLYFYPKALTGG
jgi:hypothetical protein